ncbi:MAG TPA: ADOP family duplicated permease [Gemmatimonadaceae bacterium]|jgi:putative ABC transport system permease protein|nr:ADOP family duplicated permease [Gemmatimonadaceae bacterium]
MSQLSLDIVSALRALRARPVFTATAILTLALGIGANTAIFSLLEQTLLHPVPFDTRGLVFVSVTNETRRFLMPAGNATVDAWQRSARTFEGIEAYREQELTLTGAGAPEVIPGVRVTPGLLTVLGTPPAFGRRFADADAAPGAAPVAIVSSAFAINRFGEPRAAIGKSITLDGSSRTVIGVAPHELDLARATIGGWSVYLPASVRDTLELATAIGRLRRGVTLKAATADLAAGLPKSVPGLAALRGNAPLLQRPAELVRQYAGSTLLVCAGAVGLVLLIACANVANLLLARGIERQREIALRSALGASRRRLIQQQLVESGLLAVAGGVVGVALAFWLIELVTIAWPMASGELNLRSFLGPLSPDVRLLSFSVGLSLVTGLLCGLLPALRSTARAVAGTLRSGVGITPGRRQGSLVRDALVVSQVAMSVTLLISAGLLVRHVIHLSREHLGYDPRDVLAVRPAFAGAHYANPVDRADAMTRMAEVIRRSPHVSSATIAEQAPPSLGVVLGALTIDGQSLAPSEQPAMMSKMSADSNIFAVLKAPILEGRPYASSSNTEIVINVRMARRYWPHESALGHRLRMTNDSPWLTIVGVAADVAFPESGVLIPEQMYAPLSKGEPRWLLVRTRDNPLAILPAVRTAVTGVDPRVPLAQITTVATLVEQHTVSSRITTMLLLGFAVVALGLSGIGIYGVVSFMVGQRTREIGVRMALGATQHDIRRLIAGHGGVLAGLGLVIGLPAAFALSRVVAHLATGVEPRDPLAFAIAGTVVVAVAGVASLSPTRRATRIDPARTMREE